MNRFSKLWMTLLILVILGLSLGCRVKAPEIRINTIEVGETQRETQTIEADGAESAEVSIQMGTGELAVEGGATALMEAEFTYNVAEWAPKVKYEVDDSVGQLSIRQPTSKKIPTTDEIRYEWELRFNDELPLDMQVEHGAGDGEFKLGDLNLTTLDMELGAGAVEVDLSANTSLRDLEIDLGLGDMTLDLRGDWEKDLNVDIQGGMGKITLQLPSDIGVRVDVSKGLGDVTATGLSRQGNDYVNDAYENSDVTIEINIQSGIGAIELEVVD